LADQKVYPVPPSVQEAVHVSLREPVALVRLGRFPQAVLVFDDRKIGHDHSAAASFAQPEAELDVGHPVKPEPRVESPNRERVGAAKGQAVAFDRVDVWTGARVELLERALPAKSERTGDDDGRVGECIEKRRYRVTFQLNTRIEEDHHLAGRGVDARVDSGGETKRRVERDDAKSFGGPVLEPTRDSRVSGVVDNQSFEIRLAMRENGNQPSLGVRLPAMDDGEQRDAAQGRFRLGARGGFDSDKLASGRAVCDVPSGGTKLLANRVRGLEVPGSPALDALGEKLLSFVPIRSSWL